ncbi:MAG: galactokinase [Phycisphaerae bacterium]|nr:galactokinase [Saprospiraceae bacterium]
MNASIIKSTFLTHFSTPPALIARAPGRINLIGEHTDYNHGFVLPAAIDKAIWMAAGPRTDGRFAFFAHDLGEFFISENEKPVFQERQSWANYLLGVVSEARKDGLVFGGMNLVFGGDVPLGAGLSSSAAIESGAMFILNELYNLKLSKMEIVRLAQRGENHFVGMKCGIMDMFASVMGREDHVVRLDCRSLEYEYFPFDALDFSLVLFDSGVKHALVDSEYNTRREECEAGVSILKKFDSSISSLRDVSLPFLKKHENELLATVFKRCKFIVEEIGRVERACVALQKSDFKTLGKLMFECHEGLDLDYAVCVPETNFLVESAQRFSPQGMVLGARQMGGGFGGCTINLLKTSALTAFSEETSAAYRQVFGIDLKIYPVRLTAGTEVVQTLSLPAFSFQPLPFTIQNGTTKFK